MQLMADASYYISNNDLCVSWQSSGLGCGLARPVASGLYVPARTLFVYPTSEYIWRCAALHHCCMVERLSVHMYDMAAFVHAWAPLESRWESGVRQLLCT